MKKILLPVLAMIFGIVGCATMSYYNYGVDHLSDEFDGYKIDRMTGNYIKDSDVLNLKNSVWLNAQRFIAKDGKRTYSLIVQYWDTDWLFVNEGETLVLLIDGSRYGFSGKGSGEHRDVTTGMQGAVIKESAWYDIDKNTLIKLADAKTVKMKIVGATRNITRELAPENIANYKKFVNDYVNK
jgi:hypothetical protein